MSLSKPLAVDSSRWGSLCCFSHAFPQNLTFPWLLDFSDPEHLFPHIISSRAIPLATSFPTAVWYPLLFHFLFIHEFFRLSKALNFLSSCVTLIAKSEFLTSFFFFFFKPDSCYGIPCMKSVSSGSAKCVHCSNIPSHPHGPKLDNSTQSTFHQPSTWPWSRIDLF